MKKQLAFAIAALSLAPAFSFASDEAIHAAVREVKATAVVKSIRDVPNTGMKEVIADSTVIYMDPNGQYLFFGTLLDLKNKKNLTADAQAFARTSTLASIPESEKIVFKAPNEKYRVTVFTDISCGYCRMLHENEQGYKERGITIEYVAFPRGGTRTEVFGMMRQIWCASDRNAAYAAAVGGRPVSGGVSATCNDPVAKHYELGEAMAIEGTPAIFTASGQQIGGFLTPDQMEKTLKDLGAPK